MGNEDRGTLEAVAGLSQILLAGTTVQGVLGRIVDLAAGAVDACDMASISIRERNGTIHSAAATHEKIVHLDEVQYETGQGPCIAAATEAAQAGENRIFQVADTASDGTWPDFSRAAAGSGVGSLAAFALVMEGRAVGALNLYSTRPEAFGEDDLNEGAIFAAHAAVVLVNARALSDARREVDELYEALDTRDTIGRAKGILMEREGVTDEQAFEILKRLSQHLNVKLREVAREIAESPSRPRPERATQET